MGSVSRRPGQVACCLQPGQVWFSAKAKKDMASEMEFNPEALGNIVTNPQSGITAVQEHKLHEAALTLKEGGVIICPTEGVFGISAAISKVRAIERIIKIKHRATNKGLIVVSANMSQLYPVVNFAALSQDSMKLLYSKWPGHATFIVPCQEQVPDILTGGRKTLAVRVTPYQLLSRLCEYVGEPLVSTSANISGSEPLSSLEELRRVFASEVDYILDEPCLGMNKPSTIYDAVSGAILRP